MGDFAKPLYKDYKRQAWSRLMDDRPVSSNERLYEFADRPLLILVYIEMIAALLFIWYYCPKADDTVYQIILYASLAVIAVLCWRAYRLFVYKNARFCVMWEDRLRTGAACENCDEHGKLLATLENRRAAARSRTMFIALFLLVIAAASLFYLLSWRMAEQRVRNSAELAEFVRLAERQDDMRFSISVNDIDLYAAPEPEELAQEDMGGLKEVFRELQWNYVESLSWYDGELHVYMRGGFETRYFEVIFEKQ